MKSVLRFVGLLLIILGVWYFFIKGYNYKVTFNIDQSQSIVYDHLSQWHGGKSKRDSLVENISSERFSKVVQNYRFGDSIFRFDWDLEMIDESTTKVTARIKDEAHSIKQNVGILYADNHFKRSSIDAVAKFRDGLIKNAENYKLHEVRDSIVPAENCAYISVACKTQEKASAMLKNIFYVMNYIKSHDEVELTGDPFLEVTEWNQETDSLKFDFCFPIKELKEYPERPANVGLKKTNERKALKTIFNGNYRISDRAWYQLMDYAKYNELLTDHLPVEIFRNDPHTGTNSLEWVAEVFLPIE